MAEHASGDLVVKKGIRRFFEAGSMKAFDDEVIAEARLHINLDGAPFVQTVLSPSCVREFVIGFLKTRGLIDRMEDVISLELKDDQAYVTRGPRFHGSIPSLSLLESTGSRNVPQQDSRILAEEITRSHLLVHASTLIKGVGMLAAMPLYERTGGTHCAVIFSPTGTALASAEDIGRHNAVDKVIGSGLLQGTDFSKTWLAVSGRLPADMVLKPALVGIPLIASVSAPTSEGIEMGIRAGLTVVGFTRGGRLNCYTHPERIFV